MSNIKVGNITNSIGVSIGGNVSGNVHIAGGDIIAGKQRKAEIKPCYFCNQPVEVDTTCPHCGGPYTKRD